MDKDRKSLVKLLEDKEHTTFKPERTRKTDSVKDPKFNAKRTGYTKSLRRKRYAASGSYSIQRNSGKPQALIIDVPEQQWSDEEIAAKLPDKMKFQCVLRSPNIPNFLEKLKETKVLPSPLPTYIREAIKFPQQTVRIEDDESSDEDES